MSVRSGAAAGGTVNVRTLLPQTRTDVALTLLSACIEASLIALWLRRQFVVPKSRYR